MGPLEVGGGDTGGGDTGGGEAGGGETGGGDTGGGDTGGGDTGGGDTGGGDTGGGDTGGGEAGGGEDDVRWWYQNVLLNVSGVAVVPDSPDITIVSVRYEKGVVLVGEKVAKVLADKNCRTSSISYIAAVTQRDASRDSLEARSRAVRRASLGPGVFRV